MIVVLIAPTGIGCYFGGHAGDGNTIAKLINSCCDKLITHPNVVNGSDINEMPENTLYVEGSILDRFLYGQIYLEEVYLNRILLVVNKPAIPDSINSANAARATIGADVEILELDTELKMTGFYKDGKADGKVEGWMELCKQVGEYEFDALAIQTGIIVEKETKLNYLRNGGVNPWGGIEAITSKLIANKLDKPVAHAPFFDQTKDDDLKDFNEVVDPRMAAEMVSVSYLHSVLKGLHKAPRINYEEGLSNSSIDFLISPINCNSNPHIACMENNIPIIAVKENKNVLQDNTPGDAIVVETYLEAAGVIMAYKAGVSLSSLKRPLKPIIIK